MKKINKMPYQFIKFYQIISHPLFSIILSAILFTIMREIVMFYVLGEPIGYEGSSLPVPTKPLPLEPNEHSSSFANKCKLDAPNKSKPLIINEF